MESYQKYLINSIVRRISNGKPERFELKNGLNFFISALSSYLLLEQLIKRHDSLSVEMT